MWHSWLFLFTRHSQFGSKIIEAETFSLLNTQHSQEDQYIFTTPILMIKLKWMNGKGYYELNISQCNAVVWHMNVEWLVCEYVYICICMTVRWWFIQSLDDVWVKFSCDPQQMTLCEQTIAICSKETSEERLLLPNGWTYGWKKREEEAKEYIAMSKKKKKKKS